jgi:hypothetical protein
MRHKFIFYKWQNKDISKGCVWLLFKILGLIENTDVNLISEKMVKKGTKRRELLLFVVGLRSSFRAKPLLYTAFLSVLTAVLCVL